MKKEEKIRMLLHPERYTDEQIERMLDDAPIVEPDIDEEWHQFKEGHRQHRQPMRWAAILITAAALSGISYAAIHHFQKTRENKQETIALPQKKPLAREVVWKKESQSIDSTMEKTDSTKKNQQFNNVPLQQIMQQISKDYGVEVVFINEAARNIRFYLSWEAEETLSNIVNRINHFEKVHLTLSGETITIN